MRHIEMPSKFNRMYERAMSGRSRKAAIRAHCLMCVGWLEQEVEKCTSPDCPLFHYRLATPTSDGGQTCAIEPELAMA